jgi:hypothetical protein
VSTSRAACLRVSMAASALLACTPARVAPPPSPSAAPLDAEASKRDIARTLDDMHDAAARAEEARYFAHFAADAVFLGTDAKERWDMAAFRGFAHPFFANGHAWSFRSVRRGITLSADQRIAWFDEDLATEKLGPARGSGVVARGASGTWLVEQYNLTTVVPNERFAAVRAVIDAPGVP